ncbi:MAG: hypothetical protein FJW95_12260 [Actinobacteria bacterium]|nr:hypothetical protein [Actinomycetota bacterium]
MLPFERLRALARYDGDDRALVDEVADCLADFHDDPAQLVLVCRRLLAHHATNGPLWWLCARVVGAADPAAAAVDAMRAVERDRTVERLTAVLPFPHDEPIVVLGWPEAAGAALDQRPDLDVVVVRPDRADAGMRARLGGAARTVRMVDLPEAMALDASHLIVEVLATSPTTALVPPGVADLRWGLPDAALWLVAPLDRILPERLFEVLREGADEDRGEVVPVADAARIAGPGGLDTADRFVTRLDCPLAPELLRR